jgi:IS30 family transposase
LGKGVSAIGTSVERTTRFVLLIHLESIKSEHVVGALQQHVQSLPEQLRRSVTWGQGKEMALHANFTIDTGIQIYVCDPKSPWQRGTNENTNGLLRQYFPKRTDLKPYSQAYLDKVAAELNGRPRKTLQFMTPSEKFAPSGSSPAGSCSPTTRRSATSRREAASSSARAADRGGREVESEVVAGPATHGLDAAEVPGQE